MIVENFASTKPMIKNTELLFNLMNRRIFKHNLFSFKIMLILRTFSL